MTRGITSPRAPASHANRGMYLERLIEHSWRAYMRQGIGCGQKIATPVEQDRRGGRKGESRFFRQRSTVDFMGVIRGIPVAFDAKACARAKRFDLRRLPHHQLQFLRDFEAGGGAAFVLLDFPDLEHFYAVRPDALGELAGDRKSVSAHALLTAYDHAGVAAIPRMIAVPVPFAEAAEHLWTCAHRVMLGFSEPGPYRTARVPYLRGTVKEAAP